jgi:hypothetical protein
MRISAQLESGNPRLQMAPSIVQQCLLVPFVRTLALFSLSDPSDFDQMSKDAKEMEKQLSTTKPTKLFAVIA